MFIFWRLSSSAAEWSKSPPLRAACLYALRAISYARTPSTLLALNSGATCSCSPTKPRSISSTAWRVIPFTGKRASIAFSLSYEGVVAPKLTPARYCLGLRCSSSASLVALPMQTRRTPVARGSSVPACPTFRFFLPKCLQAANFIFLITSAEVHLYGLSTGRIIPCG